MSPLHDDDVVAYSQPLFLNLAITTAAVKRKFLRIKVPIGNAAFEVYQNIFVYG